MSKSKPKTLSAKHFDALFSEATTRLREVRIGDPQSVSSTTKAIATAKDITVDTLTSLNTNPHFSRVLIFLQSQEDNANNVLLEQDATAQYNLVLAASLKVMLREVMFAKGPQRDAYLTRVHDWYNEKEGANNIVPSQQRNTNTTTTNATNNRRQHGVPESNEDSFATYDDIPVDETAEEELNGSPERLRERQARAARYATKGPANTKQMRPKSATTNVFLAGTTAGNEYDSAVSQQRRGKYSKRRSSSCNYRYNIFY